MVTNTVQKIKIHKRLNRLIPNEARRNITAKVSIVNAKTGVVVFGPTKFQASTDYNFTNPDSYNNLTLVDQNGVRDTVLDYSLGQLDAQEGAQTTSIIPASQILAEKIAQAL